MCSAASKLALRRLHEAVERVASGPSLCVATLLCSVQAACVSYSALLLLALPCGSCALSCRSAPERWLILFCPPSTLVLLTFQGCCSGGSLALFVMRSLCFEALPSLRPVAPLCQLCCSCCARAALCLSVPLQWLLPGGLGRALQCPSQVGPGRVLQWRLLVHSR